jgi:hypothetical protein
MVIVLIDGELGLRDVATTRPGESDRPRGDLILPDVDSGSEALEVGDSDSGSETAVVA